MKLKTFTAEETINLINDLNLYWNLCTEITAIARFRIEEAFTSFNRDYKWDWKTPFFRRVKSFEDMTYNLTGGQFKSVSNKFIINKGFTERLSSWYGDSDPRFDFVQKAYTDIVMTAALIGYWKDSDIATFHELVEKYAEHPLEPDEKDIELIKLVNERIEKLKFLLQRYKDAI